MKALKNDLKLIKLINNFERTLIYILSTLDIHYFFRYLSEAKLSCFSDLSWMRSRALFRHCRRWDLSWSSDRLWTLRATCCTWSGISCRFPGPALPHCANATTHSDLYQHKTHYLSFISFRTNQQRKIEIEKLNLMNCGYKISFYNKR